MNSIKYRKLYLQENWAENKFIMIKENVDIRFCPYSINFQMSHPKVLSGKAFWIYNKLCTGYYFATNPNIYRPVFSHKRQRLLDEVHGKKEECDKKDKNHNSIKNPHLGYARKKYLVAFNEYVICLDNKRIPMDCVNIILSFIHEYF